MGPERKVISVKKRLFSILLSFVLMLGLIPAVSADCAPKPSTTVQVMTDDGSQVIVTLLGPDGRYGPNGTVEPTDTPPSYISSQLQEAWYAFRDAVDPDGYQFWGELDWFDLHWGYYPPEEFKVAVYYPQTGAIHISRQVFSRYAFHSDFRLFLADVDKTASGVVDMNLQKDFDWMEEAWGFLCRAVVTLLVELALAWVLGYRSKKNIKDIALINLVTQIGLNLLLTIWYIFSGPLDALLRLVIAEILVFGVEALLYCRKLPGSHWKAVVYALAANLASVSLGWIMLD